MDLSPYVDSLRRDLMAAAAAGTDETRRTAELLAAALEPAARLAIPAPLTAAAAPAAPRRTAELLAAAMEPAARLRILAALSPATADVPAALSGVSVEVRLHAREPRISVDRLETEPEPEAGETEPAPPVDES